MYRVILRAPALKNKDRNYCLHQLFNNVLYYSYFLYAPVAQLDRVSGFEPDGRGFESLRARQKNNYNQ